jgi:hypothetical protein
VMKEAAELRAAEGKVTPTLLPRPSSIPRPWQKAPNRHCTAKNIHDQNAKKVVVVRHQRVALGKASQGRGFRTPKVTDRCHEQGPGGLGACDTCADPHSSAVALGVEHMRILDVCSSRLGRQRRVTKREGDKGAVGVQSNWRQLAGPDSTEAMNTKATALGKRHWCAAMQSKGI